MQHFDYLCQITRSVLYIVTNLLSDKFLKKKNQSWEVRFGFHNQCIWFQSGWRGLLGIKIILILVAILVLCKVDITSQDYSLFCMGYKRRRNFSFFGGHISPGDASIRRELRPDCGTFSRLDNCVGHMSLASFLDVLSIAGASGSPPLAFLLSDLPELSQPPCFSLLLFSFCWFHLSLFFLAPLIRVSLCIKY